jgi:predicted unusual protein kinase regulating ubiquinone biosynthesis (AarF/ABC1/UbiB family)
VAVFHVDPHAGNLFCDERTGEVILLDWALTQRLHREERHQLVRLILAVVLRDAAGIYEALTALSTDNIQHDPAKAAMVRRYVTHFVQRLPPWSFPSLADVMRLLDTLVLTGLSFSPSLLILRKILFTLQGVLHDVAPSVSMEPVLARYMLTQGTGSVSHLWLLRPPARTFRSLLSTRDWMQLSWSALGFSSRVWQQNATWVCNAAWQTLQRLSGQRVTAPRP